MYCTGNEWCRYLLADGEEGPVCSLGEVVYLVRVQGSQVLLLTRHQRWRIMEINPAEFHFKAAVLGESLGEENFIGTDTGTFSYWLFQLEREKTMYVFC